MQFSAKIWPKAFHTQLSSWRPLWEILDLPLEAISEPKVKSVSFNNHFKANQYRMKWIKFLNFSQILAAHFLTAI